MFIKIFSILWVSLVLFNGCAVKEYHKSEAKVIILKTPQIKFADTGYIRHNGDAVQLELYSGGQPVKRIEMNHLICVDNEGCLSKSSFNSEYLDKSYPDDLLLHVSLGKAIFEGKKLIKTDDGFEQKIKSKEYNITYRVSSKEIYFKDKNNHILVRFKTILQ
jgi:hypothetical protein